MQKILDNEEVLKNVMKEELRKIKKEYATPRKTTIEEEIEDIKIDTTEMISKEDVIVCVTKDGYVKRTSLRSYQSSNPSEVRSFFLACSYVIQKLSGIPPNLCLAKFQVGSRIVFPFTVSPFAKGNSTSINFKKP